MGRKPGFIHIQKTVRQRSIDRKFKEASQTLSYGNSVTGSIGSPFATRTKDFSAVNVNINDSFEAKQRTNKAISSIFSALEDQGAKISKGNKAYYEGLMEIAFSITEGNGALSDYGSDAETAVGVLKMFKASLAASKNQAVITQVDQLLESLDKKLHPLADNAQATLVPSKLSAREVYGRRPIKPSHLITPKKQNPRAVKRGGGISTTDCFWLLCQSGSAECSGILPSVNTLTLLLAGFFSDGWPVASKCRQPSRG